jgi:hypothetical protein
VATADALRVVKANSSRWVHRNRPLAGFEWQAGYGAFSVSHSLAPAVVQYIRDRFEIACAQGTLESGREAAAFRP